MLCADNFLFGEKSLVKSNPGCNSRITWRYLSWRADEDSAMTSEASLRAREAFCSPSAAMTYKEVNILALYLLTNLIV